MATFTFRSCAGGAGLAALRADWDALAAARQAIELHHLPDWYAAHLDTLGPAANSVEFHAVYAADKLVAIFPLRQARIDVAGITVRALVAPHDGHMPFADFVSAGGDSDDRYLPALLRHLRRTRERDWDVLTFPRVPASSAARRSVRTRTPRIACIERQGSDTIPLSADSDVIARLSRNFRKNLRKAHKKLDAMPDVEFVSARGSSELRSAFGAFLRVEASGWKGAGGSGTAIALHPPKEAFYRGLMERFGSTGQCEINLLRVGAEFVAAEFCLVVRDTYYVLKIGYDERHASFAPGNLLFEHLLARLQRASEIRRVHLITDADWHDNWQPSRTPLFEIMCANNSPRGLAAVTLLRARHAARRLARYGAPALARLRTALDRRVPRLDPALTTAASP